MATEYKPQPDTIKEGAGTEYPQINEDDGLQAAKFNYVVSAFGLEPVVPRRFIPSIPDPAALEVIGVSKLGTPVFSVVSFEPGSYEPLDGGATIVYAGITLDAVLVQVRQSKNIVKTATNGRNGTIKEFISSGDYEITLRGVITSSIGPGFANVYPSIEVETLKNIFEVPQDLEVTGPFLDIFGIDRVIVDSFDFPERAGFRDAQLFTCKLTQDTPVILRT